MLLPSLILFATPATRMTQYSTIETLKDYVGTRVTVRGWVTHLRSSGKVAFIVMRDGTGLPGGAGEVAVRGGVGTSPNYAGDVDRGNGGGARGGAGAGRV